MAVNFCAQEFEPDFIFSSNMRRYVKIQGKTNVKCIVTSNMKEVKQSDYVVNFASYALKNPEIIEDILKSSDYDENAVTMVLNSSYVSLITVKIVPSTGFKTAS